MGRHQPPALLAVAALLAVTACTGDGHNPLKLAMAEARTTTGGAAVAFRFPQRGTHATLFRLPGLDEVAWEFETGPAPVAEVVGFAGDEDLVYTLGTARHLVAIDLTSGRAHVVDSLVALATVGPTGTPYLVRADGSVKRIQRRSPVPLPDSFAAVPETIWGGVRERLIALVREQDERRLEVLTPGHQPIRQRLPEGPVAVAPWGDVAAVATDSGIVTIDPTGQDPPEFLALDQAAHLVAFSSSAHRLYVVTADHRLLSIDHLGLEVTDELPLAGAAAALRPDPFGRLLLIQPAAGDSVWLVDLTRWRVTATLPGAWDADLPTVAPDGTVLLRRGQQVLAFDVDSLRAVGEMRGAQASDRWLVAAWDPRRPALELADAETRQAERPGQIVYVQVSSTSNEAWAGDLALNLRRAGMTATVLPPDDLDEPYRVVLGPYASREQAEQIRARLQMPSWILIRDTTRTTP